MHETTTLLLVTVSNIHRFKKNHCVPGPGGEPPLRDRTQGVVYDGVEPGDSVLGD